MQEAQKQQDIQVKELSIRAQIEKAKRTDLEVQFKVKRERIVQVSQYPHTIMSRLKLLPKVG